MFAWKGLSVADQQSQAGRGRRRKATGVVVSDKRDKTVKVQVEMLIKHPRYGKYIRRRSVCQVHDENNEAQLGDKVEVMECRQISKTKHWRLVRILVKGRGGELAETKVAAED